MVFVAVGVAGRIEGPVLGDCEGGRGGVGEGPGCQGERWFVGFGEHGLLGLGCVGEVEGGLIPLARCAWRARGRGRTTIFQPWSCL